MAKMIDRLVGHACRYRFTAHSDYPERALYTAVLELVDDLKVHIHLKNNIPAVAPELDFSSIKYTRDNPAAKINKS